jgi:4-amino-4-deoxy-L-arabinose transferase-like glycosyltransferase
MTGVRERALDGIGAIRTLVPAPLAGVIAIVVLVGLGWALTVPPWQSPDETVHFAYAESLAAHHALPGNPHRAAYSSDQARADAAVGAGLGAFYPGAAPPSWSPSTFRRYVVASGSYSHSDGGGPNPISTNPPLYYLYADIAYLADSGGNAFGELYAIRIFNVLLLVATTVAGWLLAGEILGRRRLAQVTCAAVVGLTPMTTFISTAVNPDALMIVLWSYALWLGARVINHGARRRDMVGLCAVAAAAVLTKATSYALLPPVLIALALGIGQRPGPGRWRNARADLVISLSVLAAPIIAWLGLTVALNRPAVNKIADTAAAQPFKVRQLLSYVWQFYLPRLPFLTRFRQTAGLPVYDIWLKQVWGAFGWLDVGLPAWAYAFLASVTGAVLIPATAIGAVDVVRSRRWQVPAFLTLTALALLAFLHISDYRSIIAGQGPLLQGRYLLPIVGLFGLACAFVLSRAPRRVQAGLCSVVVVALLVLQVLALSTVVHGYYV